MKFVFSRAAITAVLASSLAGPAFSQDDFLRGSAPPETRAAPPPRMPDLIVNSGVVEPDGGDRVIVGGRLIVGGGFKQFIWTHRTKNAGNAAARKPSATAVEFVGSPGLPNGASKVVRDIAPGKFKGGRGSFLVSFRNCRFGTYPTQICADALNDVEESDNDNNCLNDLPIHVVPSRLPGTVSGRYKQFFDGLEVIWDAGVTYNINGIVPGDPNAAVDYMPSEVSVLYTIRGKVPGTNCRWSGGGWDKPPIEKIRLLFAPRHRFEAESRLNEDSTMRITLRCPPQRPITRRSIPLPWFVTGGYKQFQSPKFDALEGDYSLTRPSQSRVSYSWNLIAR